MLLFAFSFNDAFADADKRIYILSSTNSKNQMAIARSIEKGLQNTEYRPEILPHDDISKKNAVEADLIVSINARPSTNIINTYGTTPILHISSKVDLNNAYKERGRATSTLYITQPYCRQMQHISMVSKKWKTIGVLTSKADSIDKLTLARCAKKYGLKIYFTYIDNKDNLTSKFKKTLRNSDAILALPDTHIYNSRTVKNILLTSYRHRKPIIGFSDDFVQAGALTAIFTSPAQLSNQVVELIKGFFNNDEKFSDVIYYPKYYAITNNNQVFRALGLDIPDLEYIEKTLENMGVQQ